MSCSSVLSSMFTQPQQQNTKYWSHACSQTVTMSLKATGSLLNENTATNRASFVAAGHSPIETNNYFRRNCPIWSKCKATGRWLLIRVVDSCLSSSQIRDQRACASSHKRPILQWQWRNLCARAWSSTNDNNLQVAKELAGAHTGSQADEVFLTLHKYSSCLG